MFILTLADEHAHRLVIGSQGDGSARFGQLGDLQLTVLAGFHAADQVGEARTFLELCILGDRGKAIVQAFREVLAQKVVQVMTELVQQDGRQFTGRLWLQQRGSDHLGVQVDDTRGIVVAGFARHLLADLVYRVAQRAVTQCVLQLLVATVWQIVTEHRSEHFAEGLC